MGPRRAGRNVRGVLAFSMAAAGLVIAESNVWTEATSGEPGEKITVVVKATAEEPVSGLVVLFKFDVQAFTFLERDFSESEAARNAQSCGGGQDLSQGFALARVVSRLPPPPEGLFAAGQDWELVRFYLRVRSAAVPGAHAAGIVASLPSMHDTTAFAGLKGQQLPVTIIPGEAIVRAATHPSPPDELVCRQELRAVHLSWRNLISYEQILVVRDGATLAVLPGNADAFVDADVVEGRHAYTVQGRANAGTTVAVECGLVVGAPEIAAATKVQCREGVEGIRLLWENPLAYDRLDVRRNGETVASLPGNAVSFMDTSAPPGALLYEVVGRLAEIESTPALCMVRGQWVLRLGSAVADPVTRLAALPIYLSNPLPALGHSLVLGFDPAKLSVEGATFEGCAPEELAPFMSGETLRSAYAIFWAAFSGPTWQTLPAGLESRLMTVFLRVAPDVPIGTVLPVVLDTHAAHIPTPEIVVVVDRPFDDAIYPTLIHGEVVVGDAAVAGVRDLRARAAKGGLRLAWRNSQSYDRVEVESDGALLAALPGDAESIDDALGGEAGARWYRVRGMAGDMSSPWSSIVYTRLPGIVLFRRGDANADGRVNVADVVETCLVVHRGGRHIACEDAMDANDDGNLNVSDVVLLLRYLFAMGAEPPSPGPRVRWFDPTADLLGCGEGTP